MSFIEWNVKAYLEKASKGSFAARAARGDVFKSNNEVFANEGYRTDTGVEVVLPDKSQSIDNTIFYEEEFSVSQIPASQVSTLTGSVNCDCLSVAHELIQKGYNPALLNLADAYLACGGYYKGINAQEESLCRQTTLSQSLYQYYDEQRAQQCSVPFKGKKYPMDRNFGAVYSPNVTVFRKSRKDNFVFLENPYQLAIISCAALNFNDKGRDDLLLKTSDGGFTAEGKKVMMNKVRTIYRVGLTNGHDSLVLGAFGCGAFRLRPDTVAQIFMEVLKEEEFAGKFKFIVFAILESPVPSESGLFGKFAPFYQVFGNYACPKVLVVENPTKPKVDEDNSSENTDVKAGQRVMHHKFGEGIVKECDGTYAKVDFGGVEKKMLLAVAKLEVIG